MKSAKWLPTLILGGAVLPFASAQEFGVDSSSDLGYAKAPISTFSLNERLDGWYTAPLDAKGGAVEVRAHAQAGLPANISADFDVLSATMVFPKPGVDLKNLKWTLGRFAYRDTTGLVFSHPLDGSQLTFDFGFLDLKVTTGFTGFVTRTTSGVVLSLADQDSTALFATPRFVGALETEWTFFDSHTLTLGALAQQDLTPHEKLADEWSKVADNSTKGGKFDSQYITLKVDGPVAPRFFYDAALTFEAGTTMSQITDSSVLTFEYKPITAFLATAGLTYFIPAFFSSSFETRVLFASGDLDAKSAVEGNTAGNYTLFVPITPTTLAAVFNPGISNLGFYELGASMKPISGVPLVMGTKFFGFQRLVSGMVNASGVLSTGPVWMGEEVDFSASWQPYSDLQVTASLGAFLPTAGTFAASAPTFQYAAKIGAKLSL